MEQTPVGLTTHQTTCLLVSVRAPLVTPDFQILILEPGMHVQGRSCRRPKRRRLEHTAASTASG